MLNDFCNHHRISPSKLIKDIKETLSSTADYLALIGLPYTGFENLLNSYFSTSNDYSVKVKNDGKTVCTICNDLQVQYVQHRGKPTDELLADTIRNDIPTILTITDSPTRNSIAHYSFHKPFCSWDFHYCAAMWSNLLAECYGCSIDHGSQKQHQGPNCCYYSA
jgi:hypothetical protein